MVLCVEMPVHRILVIEVAGTLGTFDTRVFSLIVLIHPTLSIKFATALRALYLGVLLIEVLIPGYLRREFSRTFVAFEAGSGTRLGSGIKLLGSGIMLLEAGIVLLKAGIVLLKAGIRLLEAGIVLLEAGIMLLEAGIRLLESGIRMLKSGILLLGPGILLLGPGILLLGPRIRLLGSGIRLLGSGIRLLGSGIRLLRSLWAGVLVPSRAAIVVAQIGMFI